MIKLKKDDLEKIKNELEQKTELYIKNVNIIYDGRQYSIRIPAKVIKTMNIDSTKDQFQFELDIPPKITEKPQLKIMLVKND